MGHTAAVVYPAGVVPFFFFFQPAQLSTIGAAVRCVTEKSIQRRWKGFFSYTPDSRPNGAKLRRLEEKEERAQQNHRRTYSGVTQKFKNEGRDLSYLVQ